MLVTYNFDDYWKSIYWNFALALFSSCVVNKNLLIIKQRGFTKKIKLLVEEYFCRPYFLTVKKVLYMEKEDSNEIDKTNVCLLSLWIKILILICSFEILDIVI